MAQIGQLSTGCGANEAIHGAARGSQTARPRPRIEDYSKAGYSKVDISRPWYTFVNFRYQNLKTETGCGANAAVHGAARGLADSSKVDIPRS